MRALHEDCGNTELPLEARTYIFPEVTRSHIRSVCENKIKHPEQRPFLDRNECVYVVQPSTRIMHAIKLVEGYNDCRGSLECVLSSLHTKSDVRVTTSSS